jgi:hypothetical protein
MHTHSTDVACNSQVTLHLLGQLRWRSGRTLIALVGALSKMTVPVENCETVETHVSKQA